MWRGFRQTLVIYGVPYLSAYSGCAETIESLLCPSSFMTEHMCSTAVLSHAVTTTKLHRLHFPTLKSFSFIFDLQHGHIPDSVFEFY
jgi:hypothetical protein